MDSLKCATCKHYTAHPNPNLRFGQCTLISKGSNPKATIEIPGFAEGKAPFLEVTDDFGCVLHEAKEE